MPGLGREEAPVDEARRPGGDVGHRGGEGALEGDGKGNLPVEDSSVDDEVELAPVPVGIDAQEGAGVAAEEDLGLEGPAVRARSA